MAEVAPPMDCPFAPLPDDPRYVGDPVDVVTGSLVERALDARLDGPLPVLWYRHYSSARRAVNRGLGWGQTHGFDHTLRGDLDGQRYTSPAGDTIDFPALDRDGERACRDGWTLTRHDARVQVLHRLGDGAWEFVWDRVHRHALPSRFTVGEHAITLRHHDGFLASVTDANGRRITLARDTRGRITALCHGQRSLVRYAYDRDGNLAALTDRYGATVTFGWAAPGMLARRTERTGHTWRFGYDASGRCVHAGGEDGVQTVALTYLPGETVVARGDGGVWRYHHSPSGALHRIEDPCGGSQRFERDAQGRLVRERGPGGCVTRLLYDATGGVWARLAADGSEAGRRATLYELPRTAAGWEHGRSVVLPPSRTVCTRDEAGLRVREERDGCNGRARTWRYDANGNVVRYTDLEGATWRHEYASANHRVSTVDPLGHATATVFDRQEALLERVDPGGCRHGYVRDLRGAVIETWRDGALWERTERDRAGRVVAQRNPLGAVRVQYAHDRAGRITERRLATGDVQTMTYDPLGRLIRAVSASGTQTLAWDGAGHRVLDERDGLGVRHRWDIAGLAETWVLDRFVTTYARRPDGGRVVIDPTGARHRVIQPQVGVVTRALACGWTERATYNDRGRCVEKLVFPSAAPDKVWRRTYAWSPENDLQSVVDSATGTTVYRHDPAHRLESETLPDGTERAYEYDPGGTLIRGPGLGTVTHAQGQRLLTAAGEWLEYDTRGRLTERAGAEGVTRYAYDARDQLVGCEAPGLRWSARHDPLGRRVRKSVGDGVTTYWWDTERLAAERDALGRLRVYVYADEGALTPWLFIDYDGLDADPASGKRYSLHADHLGTPVAVRDARGDVVWRARIDPYGLAHIAVGEGFHQPWRFPGHYHDAETGLHDNRFRTYCPRLGRYLQPDPIGLRGGPNLYAYTANPLRQVDLRGLSCPETELSRGAQEPELEDEPDEPHLVLPTAGTAPDTFKNNCHAEAFLGEGVYRVLRRSPTLVAAVDRLLMDLWVLQVTPRGSPVGSHCDRAARRLTVSYDRINAPETAMAPLAHEVGHAVHPDPEQFPGPPAAGEDPQPYRDATLRDEAHATLFAATVRAELLADGGPDIGMSGSSGGAVDQTTEAMRSGQITEAEALDQVAELFRTRESVATEHGTLSYDQFHSRGAARRPGDPNGPSEADGSATALPTEETSP